MDEYLGADDPVGTLSGVVRDASGAVVPGAVVGVYEEGPRFSSGTRLLAICSASEKGRFELQVSPGSCLVVAIGPGDFLDALEAESLSHGVRTHVQAGEVAGGMDLRLPFSLADLGAISGVVEDGHGVGIPGIAVSVDGVSLAPGVTTTTWTDTVGRFALKGVFPGDRSLSAMGNCQFDALRQRLSLGFGEIAEVRLGLTPSVRRGSRVLILRCEDEAGKGIPGATMRIYGASSFCESVSTAESGEVRVINLPDDLTTGSSRVYAFHRGYRPKTKWLVEEDGASPTRVVVSLQPAEEPAAGPRRRVALKRRSATTPEADAVVSGTVVDLRGQPVQNATVYWSLRKETATSDTWSLDAIQVATTNRRGDFVASGLPPGPAVLTADYCSILEMGFLAVPAPKAEVVLVQGRETTGVTLQLPFATADITEVECRVRDEDGNPREGVTVTGDRLIGPAAESLSNDTDEGGRTVMLMLPGLNEVHAWETSTHEGGRQAVEVRAGERAVVELRTPRRSGEWPLSLMVQVVDEDGSAVEAAEVLLSTMEGGVGRGLTDAEGRCSFPRLHHGLLRQDLHVSAFKEGFFIGTPGATVSQWSDRSSAEAGVVLRRPVSIRVKVVEDETGGPVPNCKVRVAWTLGCQVGQYGQWDHEEGLRVDMLPGEVLFRAAAPGYELAEGRGEVRYGEPEPVFTLRLRRSTGQG